VIAKAATAKVPIVFAIGSDPVRNGLFDSLNRPGGNVTGVTSVAARTIGLLINHSGPVAENQLESLQAETLALGLELFNQSLAELEP
jgi:putative tryptophan/tyrosine transport system substrate-binding protein